MKEIDATTDKGMQEMLKVLQESENLRVLKSLDWTEKFEDIRKYIYDNYYKQQPNEIPLERLEQLYRNLKRWKNQFTELNEAGIAEWIKETLESIDLQIKYLKAGKKSDKLNEIEKILPDINLIFKDSTLAQWEQFINGEVLTNTIRIKADSLKHFIQFYDILKQKIGINHTDKLTEEIKAFRFKGENVTASQMKYSRSYSKRKPN